ncbi:hypothetical protein KC19_1G072000 [Ceratodon purpureus]|uniref:Uncharacterized protein n=1 Tax=Ceratodon purpureus TaxID=3225 RepID=A0A8T0J3H0_CERPU|nr:hypothetical protein KC19_1G072000 [Ceratodon purpureus]
MATAMATIALLPLSNKLRHHGVVARSPGSASSAQFFCGEVLVGRQELWRAGGHRRARGSISCEAKKETSQTPPTADASPLVKMAWYGSEAFGKAVAAFRPSSGREDEEDVEVYAGPVPRTEAVELIRKDYERSYFVTGNMNMGIYEADCEFADPFVSFRGLKRFKQNVSNLGSFMEESSLKITDWQEYEDRIYAKWRFNCVLGLPWRPILAATGSTEYFFDSNSGKICKHVENWDISPADGVRQLFKPNPKRKNKS